MKPLRLFHYKPVDADILMQPIALLGNRGSGKTYAGTKLFEEAHEHNVQCVAVDPTGKFWALRLAADGKSPGLKNVYIFGGKRADMPIAPDKGALVAKAIVEKNLHAVLDVSQMRKGERRRFCSDFFEELFLLKKAQDNPSPCTLFLEEAHALCPQKPQPDEARMLGAVEDLVREGRNCGVGVVVMDQRPATVNKNVLALTEALIVLRTTWPVDRKVYQEWVVQKGAPGADLIDFDQVLPNLKAGHGYFYWPVESLFHEVQITEKWTFDASATVKIGAKRREAGKLGEVDVEALRESLGEAAQQLEAEDPKALKRQIYELQTKLSTKPDYAMAWETKIVEKPVPMKRELQQLRKQLVLADSLSQRLAARLRETIGEFRAVNARLKQITGEGIPELPPASNSIDSRPVMPAPAKPPPIRVSRVAPVRAPPGEGAARLPEGEAKILAALSLRHPNHTSKTAAGTMTGYPARKSTFRAYVQRLKAKGLIDATADALTLTPQGIAAARPYLDSVPRTPVERIEWWKQQLPSGEHALFAHLVDAGEHGLSRERLGELTGYHAHQSTFRAYAQRLKAKGIIEKAGDGFRAARELFE